MNQNLAALFAQRLRTLPFADRLAGLVRPMEREYPDGERTALRRYPVPINLPLEACDNLDTFLLPDPSTTSIHFFEDGGSHPVEFGNGVKGFESSLRLLGWLNPERLTLPLSDARWQAAVIEALTLKLPATTVYNNLRVQYRTLPADASLWAKYTYKEPLLYYPYQLLGLELTCSYTYRLTCANDPLPQPKEPDCPTYVAPNIDQFNQQQYSNQYS